MASQDHPAHTRVPELLPTCSTGNSRRLPPNQKWVSDITYIDTAEGWLYLAFVLDLYSRLVVGWAMAEQMDADLVEDAWKMAIAQSPTGCRFAASLRSGQPVHQ